MGLRDTQRRRRPKSRSATRRSAHTPRAPPSARLGEGAIQRNPRVRVTPKGIPQRRLGCRRRRVRAGATPCRSRSLHRRSGRGAHRGRAAVPEKVKASRRPRSPNATASTAARPAGRVAASLAVKAIRPMRRPISIATIIATTKPPTAATVRMRVGTRKHTSQPCRSW